MDVAALRKKVAALETQVVTLEADKKVREQMNDYMRDQFESMNAKALEVSRENGQLAQQVLTLNAENKRLQGMLPERGQGVENRNYDNL